MPGDLGRDCALPLLPSGVPVFDGLPMGAVVLDALAPAVGNGMILLRDRGCEGVVVIRDGIASEQVWVADGVRSDGPEAMTLIRAAASATVAACRLSDDAMAVVGPLLRGVPSYTDLRLEWVVWSQLLDDLRKRSGAFAVEISTPSGRAVTVLENGRQIFSFGDSHPALCDPSLLDDLAAGGVGTIRVLVDRGGASAVGSDQSSRAARSVADTPRQPIGGAVPEPVTEAVGEFVTGPMRAPAADSGHEPVTGHTGQPAADLGHEPVTDHAGQPAIELERGPMIYPLREPVVPAAVQDRGHPTAVSEDDPNATLSALFGPRRDGRGDGTLTGVEGSRRRSPIQVASLLPELKSLVQNRLQRSSETVEEVVDGAASDHQSVEWLADRVRVMTMRGFMHGTFDQLADDMLALAGSYPD